MSVAISSSCNMTIAEMIRRSPVADMPEAVSILREAILRSQEVWYGFHNGEFACAWGVIPPTLLSNVAYLWLITTDVVEKHKFTFIRHSQLQMERMLKRYPAIIGDCLVDNELAKQWLKWLGAEFGTPIGRRLTFSIQRKKNG